MRTVTVEVLIINGLRILEIKHKYSTILTHSAPSHQPFLNLAQISTYTESNLFGLLSRTSGYFHPRKSGTSYVSPRLPRLPLPSHLHSTPPPAFPPANTLARVGEPLLRMTASTQILRDKIAQPFSFRIQSPADDGYGLGVTLPILLIRVSNSYLEEPLPLYLRTYAFLPYV